MMMHMDSNGMNDNDSDGSDAMRYRIEIESIVIVDDFTIYE